MKKTTPPKEKSIVVSEARVRRLPPKEGANVTALENRQPKNVCKICNKPAKSRLGVNVVVGTIWISACSKCLKKISAGGEFLRKLAEIGNE